MNRTGDISTNQALTDYRLWNWQFRGRLGNFVTQTGNASIISKTGLYVRRKGSCAGKRFKEAAVGRPTKALPVPTAPAPFGPNPFSTRLFTAL